MTLPVKPACSTDYKLERFGILNPYGQFWTPDTFNSRDDAEQCIRNFWRGQAADDFLKRAKIIPVKITVEESRSTTRLEGEGE